MALAPEEKLTYKEAGPAGQSTFEAGVAGFEAKAFRGCGVVTSEPYEVSDDQVRSPAAAPLFSRLLTGARAPPSAGLGPDVRRAACSRTHALARALAHASHFAAAQAHPLDPDRRVLRHVRRSRPPDPRWTRRLDSVCLCARAQDAAADQAHRR